MRYAFTVLFFSSVIYSVYSMSLKEYCNGKDKCPEFSVTKGSATEDYEERCYEKSTWITASYNNQDEKTLKTLYLNLNRYMVRIKRRRKNPVLLVMPMTEKPGFQKLSMNYFISNTHKDVIKPAPMNKDVVIDQRPVSCYYVYKAKGKKKNLEEQLNALKEALKKADKYTSDVNFYYVNTYSKKVGAKLHKLIEVMLKKY
ncbi:uncharacterized protein LOC130641036 isoform X2 [Hydractinia symbiolongicarpus]|nr:uncharacterized protein LOC130641036 isoform X2 [Hydractinia symbiolongicarpus]